MWNRNAQYHEWLLPYLEGGLDEARRAQLEARLGADPALAAEAERLRRTLAGLRGTSVRTPQQENAQVPADLWPHLRARLVLEPAPRPRSSRARWVVGLGAPAAAAVIVAAFWLPGWHTPDMAPHSSKPSIRPKAVAPSSGPLPKGHPLSGGPTPAAKPLTATKAVVPPRPTTVVTGATPFDLPISPLNKPEGRRIGPPAPVAAIAPVPADRTAPAAHRSAAANGQPAASAPAVIAPLPAPVPPPPGHTAATEQGVPPAAFAPSKAVGAAGMSGGAAGPMAAAAPKETGNGLNSADRLPAKPQPVAVPNSPSAALSGQVGPPPQGVLRNKMASRRAAPAAPGNAAQAFAAGPQGDLDSWQATLSAAVRPSLWGETEGDAQANQALMAAREAGMLDDLRARLEARRAQSPRDVVTGRMLAAVYDFGFSKEAALRERRRITGLEGADGEDWYALAQAEERAGHGPAAQAAYRRALEASLPLSPFHAAIARGRS